MKCDFANRRRLSAGQGRQSGFVRYGMTMWNDATANGRWTDLITGCHWTISLPTVISGECHRPNGGGRSAFQMCGKGQRNDEWQRE